MIYGVFYIAKKRIVTVVCTESGGLYFWKRKLGRFIGLYHFANI